MALVLKSLRCPHCQQPVDKPLLKERGLLQTFLKRKPFPCPHCEEQVVLPEKYETLISVGILISVILAPLLLIWEVSFLDSRAVFGLGAALAITGLITQKLDKA
ncbi:hypothetical protein KOI40_06975 [Aestuariicella sp. G3-2]|uniref:hypothetical protein n=1 Tax=Pseudomaricurvus albidus TaxID=2842452 RepID=UPI001C0D25BB|nr:hypothetical protein [Aestuariicella albida]MBU3069559.1 hypothetical protein [Aestuariicella albida]